MCCRTLERSADESFSVPAGRRQRRDYRELGGTNVGAAARGVRSGASFSAWPAASSEHKDGGDSTENDKDEDNCHWLM